MSRTLVGSILGGLALTLFVLVLQPAPALAAVCADHPNQAAAQQAKDTLDGDGDGVFCEAIPCPCSPEWQIQHGADPNAQQPSTPSKAPAMTHIYNGTIMRVVDGDTLKVRVKQQTKTVRVLGIDTPESKKPNVAVQCGALEATSAAIRWSFKRRRDTDKDGLYDAGTGGHKVKLRTDNTQTLTDKYGRLLAYVNRGSSDFGKSQVSAGWAELFVWADNPFERVAGYRAALEQARERGRGAWSLCPGAFRAR